MWKVISSSNIDKKRWDKAITESFNSSVLALSWYLDSTNPKWQALVFNDYEAVFPLSVGKKFGVSYLYQPHFTNYFDVYTSNKSIYTKLLQEALVKITSDYKFIDVNIPTVGYLGQVKLTAKHSQMLQLNQSHSDSVKKYSENTVRNIKKAQKNIFALHTAIEAEDFVRLFKKYTHKKISAYNSKEYKMMIEIMKQSTANGVGKIYVLKKEQEVIAASYYLVWQNRVLYFKGFTTEVGKSIGAMHYIMDKVIKEYQNKDFVLDFGGSNVDSVARFNKGFGAVDYTYLNFKYNKLPRIISVFKK
ncbi:MAG: GNAT family N-acetyltransferase [Bacteroidetes bacterium]|nr:GNAT family N-acetyltransferase [Bacteroidota bacterium]